MPTPVLFLSHGPGPMWLLQRDDLPEGRKDAGYDSPCAKNLRSLVAKHNLPKSPRALLVVSAHHVEREHTVVMAEKPGLLYDYYGFPDVAYKVKWDAPGSPWLAGRVQDLLQQAGITCQTHHQRGLDHGVFVPLSLVYPKAQIPVVQVSLKANMSFSEHLKFGEALSALRNEDVMIVCSGHTTHNSGGRGSQPPAWYEPFLKWFKDVFSSETLSPGERKQRLEATKHDLGGTYKGAHPTDEHFLPALVAAAAAGYKHAAILCEDVMWSSLHVSHLRFD